MSRRTIGSKSEIEPGKWRLSVSAGRDPVTGKRRRHTKVFYGTDRESDLELSRMVLATGKTVSTSAMTVWQFIETMYLPAIEPPELRRRTVDGYRDKLTRYVKPTIGDVRLDRLNAYACVSWMRGIKTTVPNRQTQLHVYRALSAALGRAVKWGILEENVLTRSVDPPTPAEYVPPVLTEEEANDYLDGFVGHPQEPVVVLALAGGLRPSEIYAVTWADVDFAVGGVSVDKGLHQQHGEVWLEDTKSRASKRFVQLPPWAMDALERHRGLGRVIGDLKPSQVAHRYRKHVTDSGLSPWCPIENLRHTSLTIASEGGVDWNALASRAGHSSAKMLEQRYVRRRLLRDQQGATVMQEFRRVAPADKAAER